MAKRLALILFAAALGIFQSSFITALPRPWSAVELPLLFVVALVCNFRFDDALIAAGTSGVVLGMLSPTPFGIVAAVWIALAAGIIALFTTVFTNHAWPGVLGINAVAYLALRAAVTATGMIAAAFSNAPTIGIAVDPVGLLSSLGVQLVAAAALLWAGDIAKKIASPFLFIR